MGRSYAIALNAFREAIRDRVLFGVLGLAAASLLLGLALAGLSVGEQLRVLVDHGLVTVSWLANIVAVFLGASFLYKEIELRTLYVILAKPVARWQFVLGKYLGIVATCGVFIALTGALLLVLVDLQAAETAPGSTAAGARLAQWLAASRGSRLLALLAGGLAVGGGYALALRSPRLRAARDALGPAVTGVLSLALLGGAALAAHTVAPSDTVLVLRGCLLVLFEVGVTAAVALFFSSFSTPFVTGALSLGVFLIGRSAGLMLELRNRALGVDVRALLRGVSAVVPNLQLYVPSRQALLPSALGDDVSGYLAHSALHGLAWAALLLLGAALLFRKRDLL